MLRADNDNLKAENSHLQAELRCLSCPSCGGPTVLGDIPFNELHIENCRLREEVTPIIHNHLKYWFGSDYLKRISAF